jgi:hypothetical protein
LQFCKSFTTLCIYLSTSECTIFPPLLEWL